MKAELSLFAGWPFRRRPWVLPGACGLLLALSAAATAAVPAVRFAGDQNYPPFHFVDDSGYATGFDVELFRALAETGGLRVEYRLGDWSQRLQQLERGEVDVVPMFVSAERRQRFLFSQTFLRRYHLVFGHRGLPFVTSLDSLAGQRVAVQYAGLAWESLQLLPKPVHIVPVTIEADALAAVQRGAADYALVPTVIGYQALVRQRLDKVVALSAPLLEREYAYAVSRSRPELVAIIDDALSAVQTSGRQDQLYLHWLANLKPTEESYRSGLMRGALIALALLLALGLWMRRLVLRARRRAALQEQRAQRETERRLALEAQARFLAFNDARTGLPNRNALLERLPQLLIPGRKVAVMRLDLIGLDVIRSVAGQTQCDQIKRSIADRLRYTCGEGSLFSLGRGEFAILQEAPSLAQARGWVQRLIHVVHQRLALGELSLEQRCRVGMALFPEHADGAESALRAADMACAQAHAQNLMHCEYSPELEPDPRNLGLLADLHEAILQSSLGFALQPKLDLNSRRIVGAEMLVRWQHPEYGYIAPNVFIPLVEKTGLIGEMTRYLLDRAVQRLRHWRERGIDLTMAVNVSANDLADETLVEFLLQHSAELDGRLVLELTETDVMRDSARVLASVNRLRRCGVKISLDDFGTGWSSLSYLRQMAPDELKIDRSFVAELVHLRSDQAIVRAIIQLAHHLGARVTAEGIEDPVTLDWLTRAGCDTAQGFGIARPMEPDALDEFTLPLPMSLPLGREWRPSGLQAGAA